MAILPFEASVRHSADADIVDMRGEIDGFAEEALNNAYAQVAASAQAVVLNFTEVNYINSTGIALIVSLLAQARKMGKRLITYGLSEHYVEIFKITRLSDFMNILADEQAALLAAHDGK